MALLGIVFGERLDFMRHYGAGAQPALLAALADDKVTKLQFPEKSRLLPTA